MEEERGNIWAEKAQGKMVRGRDRPNKKKEGREDEKEGGVRGRPRKMLMGKEEASAAGGKKGTFEKE